MFVYAMEYLSDDHFTHLNTADDISGWTSDDIKVQYCLAGRNIAGVHAFIL